MLLGLRDLHLERWGNGHGDHADDPQLSTVRVEDLAEGGKSCLVLRAPLGSDQEPGGQTLLLPHLTPLMLERAGCSRILPAGSS